MEQTARPGMELPAGLSALLARADAGRGPAPVELWEPDCCGAIPMTIRRDGSWAYMGSTITRPAMVRLFSTVLRKDADGVTYLVTPVEKVAIKVEDAPFLAVEMFAEGEGDGRRLTVRTNLGDVVEIGPEHPLRFAIDPANGGVKPYVRVRGRLEALFSRALTHDLLALIEAIEGEARAGKTGGQWGIHAGGMVFLLELNGAEEADAAGGAP